MATKFLKHLALEENHFVGTDNDKAVASSTLREGAGAE
jgi:hypothetical protein